MRGNLNTGPDALRLNCKLRGLTGPEKLRAQLAGRRNQQRAGGVARHRSVRAGHGRSALERAGKVNLNDGIIGPASPDANATSGLDLSRRDTHVIEGDDLVEKGRHRFELQHEVRGAGGDVKGGILETDIQLRLAVRKKLVGPGGRAEIGNGDEIRRTGAV